MKFVFIATMPGAPWGGSEELWSQAALRLRETGHEVTASVVSWPTLSPRITALTERGIEVCVRHVPSTSLTDRIRHKVLPRQTGDEWLRRTRPTLAVISQGGNSDGREWMTVCRNAGIPFVALSQSNAGRFWPTDEWAAELGAGYQAARKVFCVSRNNLALLERQTGTILSKAVIVRNPFNVTLNGPVAWPSITDVWRMASVARLEPASKGQDLLFQVLALPQWRDRPVEVNLYGTGPCERTLRQLASRLRLGNVFFRDHVPDVNTIWGDNHILVLPSRYEGLPLALVEAMWCGRPALVTDVGDCADLCADGKTGFVVPAPTVALLEQTLERAWNCRSDWQRIGKAARVRVEGLIPRDPVGEFCNQLVECASPS